MPRPLTPGTSVEHLRKEAKRWLKDLRANAPDARARLAGAWPAAPPEPGLRDVQYALALEYGFAGWTALTSAADTLGRNAAPLDYALQTLLRAADQGDVTVLIETLNRYPGLINERGILEGHTGLRTALHFGQGHAAIVKALLERGADPNIRDEGDNAFPLHFAAEDGNLEVIRLLVEHGAQTVAGEGDDHQLDIIGWATCFPNVETKPDVVEYLLAHGARHTLHSAVAVGDVDSILARARENPAAIERPMDRVNRHRRALHLAVVKNQPASVAALLALGADPNSRDAGGLSPLDEAAIANQRDIANLLLEHGGELTLASAVAFERTDDVERLLRDDPDALEPGHRWGTLIVRAAAAASPEIVETLLRLGASVNVSDDSTTAVDETHGYTALHAAAWRGSLPVTEVLLKHGANVRMRDSRYGGTPVGWASLARKQAVFERLLEADIDIFDAIDFDRQGRIPEILRRDPSALRRPFLEYLPAGSRPGPWCPDPDLTPLTWAAAEGKVEAARALMSHGAELVSAGHLAKTHEERVASFLRMACLDWGVGGEDRPRHTHAAERLLRRFPELARANLDTAVVCGEVAEVRRRLDAEPALVSAHGGPRQWPPLLYLCTARLPGYPAAAANAIAVASLLLDRGADPNVYYAGGNESIHYTALTSVIGRGEEQAATHPEARALSALLLDRGAEPYDQQVLYNAFAGHASHPLLKDDDLVWALELMYQASVKRGRAADWANPDWPHLSMGGYGGGAWYLLSNALAGNYLGIAEWALSHGANPNPPRATDQRTPQGSLHEQAVRAGLFDFAELLFRYGAPRDLRAAGPADDFETACFQMDRDRVRGMATASPELLKEASPLMRAATFDRADVAGLLLDLGMSPNVQDRQKTRPLHTAGWSGSAAVATLLLQRGADPDPIDDVHGTTPIYWAFFGQRLNVVDLLSRVSRDVWTLTMADKLERLHEVLNAEPGLASVSSEQWGTPLFMLPDDEDRAAEIVRLFLSHGATAAFRRHDGATAADIGRARGLDAAADLLERAAKT